MLKRIFQGCAFAAIFGFSASASASFIVNTVYQDKLISTGQTYSYTHNLRDTLNQTGGSFTLGNASSGTLQISLYDDQSSNEGIIEFWLGDIETSMVMVEDFDFDTGGISFGDFDRPLEIQALAAINTDGLLDVTIMSLAGDFYVGNSVLTVDVPEPASLALFGLALVGLGFSTRKKSFK